MRRRPLQLSNAIKFNRDGGRVRVALRSAPALPGAPPAFEFAVEGRRRGYPAAGGSSWPNVVTAWRSYNTHKNNRRPEEVNMPLIYVP